MTVVACIGLLSWWQKDFHAQTELTTALLILLGVLASVLTARSRRMGYWLSAFLGLGYLAEIVWLAFPGSLHHVSPLLAWAAGLFGVSAGLLWDSREKSKPEPMYERIGEY